MNASELYQAGKLGEAIEAGIAHVKTSPTDGDARYFLAELFCFAGDLERADRQLDTISQQMPEMAVRVSLIRQLVRAETARQQFFCEGRVPEVLFEVSPQMKLHLDASIAVREGKDDEAAAKLQQAEEQRRPLAGKHGDSPFDDFRDLDDMTSSFFEVLTSTGKYFWVPMTRVRSMEFHAPERPTDLVWRRVSIEVEGGPEGDVYMPTLYAGTAAAGDDQLKLGRASDWIGGEGQWTRGVGQRMYLVGEEAVSVMQLTRLEFQVAT